MIKTRKEEIQFKSGSITDGMIAHNVPYRECKGYYEGFIDGANWADNHPKSPWISVKEDLPYNHKELISSEDRRSTLYVIALVHGVVVSSRMEKFEGEWHWITDEPTYWMPIPDLPKEAAEDAFLFQ